MPSIVAVIFVSTIIGGIFALWFLRVSKSGLPPGPIPLPIIGSANLVGKTPHRALATLAKTYGPLFTIYLGPFPALIVSDPTLIRKLFANTPFLSRPQHSIRLRIFGYGFTTLATMPDSDLWRSYRRQVHSILNETAVSKQGPVIDEEIDALLARWTCSASTGTPLKPREALKFMTLNIVFSAVYGARHKDLDDPDFLRLSRTFGISQLTGVPKPTDVIMQYIQGSETSRLAALTTDVANYHIEKINKIKTLLDEGEPAPECYTTTLLKQIDKDTPIDSILKVTRDIIGGGYETTATSVEWIIAFLVNHPDVQRKAHEELDRVVGRGRVPKYEDQDKLVYLKSIIRETQRIRTPVPLGIPHAASEDAKIEFNGVTYSISKGTMIMANFSAIHENMYPDSPHEFRPERHLESIMNSESKLGYLSENMFSFGTGRRICPGISLAARVLLVTVARILHKFEFSVEGGKEVRVDEKVGLTVWPIEEVEVTVKIRSQ